MPTFPSPPLKFRTAGFPRYGFKASLSGRAFPNASAVKPAPGMLVSAPGLHRPFARFHNGHAGPAQCPDPAVLPRAAVREAHGLSTPGVLGSGAGYVVPLPHRLLRPHPPVSPARDDFTALPFIRRDFAVRERRGDPRDLPYFCTRAFHTCRRPYAGGPLSLPVVLIQRCQAPSSEYGVAIHISLPLPAILGRYRFSALHRSLHAAARMFAKPSGLATTKWSHMLSAPPAEDALRSAC